MPTNNLVDDPMCPHCHTFLEYNYTGYHDVDEDTATFNERFFCPNCQREFWATSVYEFKGYKDIKELGGKTQVLFSFQETSPGRF